MGNGKTFFHWSIRIFHGRTENDPWAIAGRRHWAEARARTRPGSSKKETGQRGGHEDDAIGTLRGSGETLELDKFFFLYSAIGEVPRFQFARENFSWLLVWLLFPSELRRREGKRSLVGTGRKNINGEISRLFVGGRVTGGGGGRKGSTGRRVFVAAMWWYFLK